jgi:hypothetical protein
MRKLVVLSLALFVSVPFAHAQPLETSKPDHANMDHSAHMKIMAETQRQAEVSKLGKEVMPFSLNPTTHIFTKNAQGGVQRVIVKNPLDTAQVNLIRQHLLDIQQQFLKGDFSGPSHLHGPEMPGLAQLKNAKAGQIVIAYREVQRGAQLTYTTSEATLVAALHKWFEAQLSDHGEDATDVVNPDQRPSR